jgi:hypothetical protein
MALASDPFDAQPYSSQAHWPILPATTSPCAQLAANTGNKACPRKIDPLKSNAWLQAGVAANPKTNRNMGPVIK